MLGWHIAKLVFQNPTPLSSTLGISIIMVVSVHTEAQCKCPIFITQGVLRNVRKHEICTGLFTYVFEMYWFVYTCIWNVLVCLHMYLKCTGLFTHVFEGENKGEIEGTWYDWKAHKCNNYNYVKLEAVLFVPCKLRSIISGTSFQNCSFLWCWSC